MKSLRTISAIAFIGFLVFSSGVSAAIESNAPVVKLRDSSNGGCMDAGAPINNCFDGLNAVTDLITWISGTRKPSVSSPLLVEVGSGTYPGFICSNWGYTTFRGAGRGRTTFTGVLDEMGRFRNALKTNGCTELEFQHMTFSATGFLSAAVRWIGPGNSRWVNVELIGEGYGWYESGSSATQCSDAIQGNSGKHYWFDSKIMTTGTSPSLSRAYKDVCGSENWFFASELLAQATVPQEAIYALEQTGISDTHFYGSVIRVTTSVPTTAIAIFASAGDVHVHGTGIDVISTALGSSVTAISASNGAMIHASGVGYNLKAGSDTETVTRITNNGGHVHAPYLWEHVPASPLESLSGADMTTVIASDGHPHLVIYDKSCISSKWYDTVDKACR